MKISRLLSILTISAVALASPQATAQPANGGGAVAALALYASNYGSNNYMTVAGFAATGTTCPQLNGNARLAFKIDENGKQMFALAMSAMLAGKQIGVGVDDTDKDQHGYCYLRWMNIQP